MARIKIEDLSLLEDLPQDEQKAILGGSFAGLEDGAITSGLTAPEGGTASNDARTIIGL
jgi:hypothetical protein